MKTSLLQRLLPRLLSLWLLVGLSLHPVQTRAASGTPPERMTYQGYLVDANGSALAPSTPRNYDVIFRIYASATGNDRLWSEQQTVTVDKGYFSVLLGEGTAPSNETRPTLSSLFADASASDRYIGITVLNPGNTAVEITPRMQLLTSPYAFLARSAGTLVDPAGTTVVSAVGGSVAINKPTASSTLDVNGTVTATQFSGGGNAITGLNISQATTGTLPDARLSGNVAMRNASQTFSGNLTVNGAVSATSVAGNGTIPIGGIIMWSGASVPAGWALCNGQNGTPDLSGRFIRAASTVPASGPLTGGSDTVTLSVGQLPPHNVRYRDHYYIENFNAVNNRTVFTDGINNIGGTVFVGGNYVGSSGTDTDNNTFVFMERYSDSVGSGQAVTTTPPYYQLAFIMRIN